MPGKEYLMKHLMNKIRASIAFRLLSGFRLLEYNGQAIFPIFKNDGEKPFDRVFYLAKDGVKMCFSQGVIDAR